MTCVVLYHRPCFVYVLRVTGCSPPLQGWSLMGGWSSRAVLELYRALLRAGRHLQYTDRNYYRRAVAREFRRCQALTAPEDKEEALKRGQFFLSSRLGGLM
ncbi:mitochondrial ribosome and complex I assembly factor AltMIEF1-like [Festucalex cinctus]